ncbi:hypothetical protein [Segetibacter sp.]|uniref:hypothetical protein n=1 Tax=Segetibacter sp. TaxID=2231182 RepID=UPI002625B411|nr:hypothetical protein [Segetibacter sp.]MCW3080130.1 hypothetical protein [Segetibacter sp.]
MADWKNILSDNEEQLTEEELLRYLDENTAEEEKDSIQHKINNSPFEVDALQGLLQVKDKKNLQKQVNQLNQKLQQLTAKKQRKEKREIKIYQWIVLAILMLLFTCVIAYIIIYLHGRSNVQSENLLKSTAYIIAVG